MIEDNKEFFMWLLIWGCIVLVIAFKWISRQESKRSKIDPFQSDLQKVAKSLEEDLTKKAKSS